MTTIEAKLDECIALLERVGFNHNDARVYVALLRQGESNPAELANAFGIDRARVYDSLKRLISLDYVKKEDTESRPRYWPSDPNRVLASIVEDFRQRIGVAESLKENLAGVYAAARPQNDRYWNVEGEDKIRDIVKGIIQGARQRLILIVTPDLLVPGQGNPWVLKRLLNALTEIAVPLAEAKLALPIAHLQASAATKGLLGDIQGKGVDVFDLKVAVLPYGLYLNEGAFLFTPLSSFEFVPKYASGIWAENATEEKLRGFVHLANWFTASAGLANQCVRWVG